MSRNHSFSMYSSAIPYPPYHNSSQLDRSLIELELKKPAFLFHEQHQPLPVNTSSYDKYHLSEESTARLEQLDRNPFYKHSQVRLPYDMPSVQRSKKAEFIGESEPIQTEEDYHVQQYRDIFSAIVQQHAKREVPPEPEPRPQPQPSPSPQVHQPELNEQAKQQRIEEILAGVARMHLGQDNPSKENKTNTHYLPSYHQEESNQHLNTGYQLLGNYYNNNQGYTPFSEEPRNNYDKRRQSQEEGRTNPAYRDTTPTIIHQLIEEPLGHKLVSSQVEEFPNEDPIVYWARKESHQPSVPQAASIPRSITLRGKTYELVPV